jgi:DNA-binding MarR family transcriptional regulator
MGAMIASPSSDLQAVASGLLSGIGSLRRSLRRDVGRPAELEGLTDAQRELARLVGRTPGVSVAEAARELRLAPNTVSTLVRQLREAGVLLRVADGADRRVARLALVPAVRETVEAWRDRRSYALARAIEQLPARDQRRLSDVVPLLARLADEVDEA